MNTDVTPPRSVTHEADDLIKWATKQSVGLLALLVFIASIYWQELGHHFGLPVNFGSTSSIAAFPVFAGWLVLFSAVLSAMLLMPGFLLFSPFGTKKATFASVLFDRAAAEHLKRRVHVRWVVLAMVVMGGWLGVLSAAHNLPPLSVAGLVVAKLVIDGAVALWACWLVVPHPLTAGGWAGLGWRIVLWWGIHTVTDFVVLAAGSSTATDGSSVDVANRVMYALVIAGVIAVAQIVMASRVALGWRSGTVRHAFLAALLLSALPVLHPPLAATMAAAPYRMAGPDGTLCVVLAYNEGKVASGWKDVQEKGFDRTVPLRMAIRVEDTLYLKKDFFSSTSVVPANELRRVDSCPPTTTSTAAGKAPRENAAGNTAWSADWASPAFWVSVASFLLALVVYFSTRKLWQESNRPVLAVRIRAHSGGNSAIALELVVENAGTRPALDIKLTADETSVRAAMAGDTLAPLPEDARRVLFDQRYIPLLANGQLASNAFGRLGPGGDWVAGKAFTVDARYRAMDGRVFRERFPVVLADDAGFAGTFWRLQEKQS